MTALTSDDAFVPPPIKPDPIATIAALREEADALEIEIGQYERVRSELEKRIAESRVRIVHLRGRITKLRAAHAQGQEAAPQASNEG